MHTFPTTVQYDTHRLKNNVFFWPLVHSASARTSAHGARLLLATDATAAAEQRHPHARPAPPRTPRHPREPGEGRGLAMRARPLRWT